MSDALERIWRRLVVAIGRGRVTIVDDAAQVQRMQVQLSADEIKDGTPRLAEYGFQSNPPPGSDCVVLFLAGERTNGVVVATGNQTWRLRALATGEVALSDDKGQKVYLSADGIRIDGGGLPMQIFNTPSLTINSPAVHMTGALTVDGAINSGTTVTAAVDVKDQSGSKSMAGMRTAYNAHHHGASTTTDHPM